MLACFIVAIVLFILAGIGHFRNPVWPYNSALIAWGLVFLTAALGWAPIHAAFQ